MARNLKVGEQVTVDRVIDLDPTSEPYESGLIHLEPGKVGIIVGPAPQGRASIVEFEGVKTTLSHRRLTRIEDKPIRKKRGRKKKEVSTPKETKVSRQRSIKATQPAHVDETQIQLVTMIANTLLLNGGLKDDENAAIHMQFTDLPESIKTQIRMLIEAKLALSGPTLSNK